MATLRLKFPEKSEPTTLMLSGSRVTLGRLPLNTIQIIDRTLSGFHAEFVLEDDHYRLHDRGSTNGTFVNGEAVSDFHLREGCKISFGSLECEFSPESPAPADSANIEALPTRSEINAVRQENVELKARVEALQTELETLKKSRESESEAAAKSVAREDYDKLVAERETLQEAQRTSAAEIERLKSELSQLQRDRESLKQLADDAKAEIATLQPAPTPEPAAKAEPTAPAIPSEEPPPAAPSPVAEPAPAAEAAPAPTPAGPPKDLPKPSFPLPGVKPLAKPPGALPGVPAKLPVAATAKPGPFAPPTVKPATPGAAAPAGATPPAPGLKPIARPLPKAPSSVMKGGTDKIDPEAAAAVKPIIPAVKATPKPPVKLPIQPTVRLQPGVKPSLPPEDKGQ